MGYVALEIGNIVVHGASCVKVAAVHTQHAELVVADDGLADIARHRPRGVRRYKRGLPFEGIGIHINCQYRFALSVALFWRGV